MNIVAIVLQVLLGLVFLLSGRMKPKNWLSRISWAKGCGIIKGEQSSQTSPM